MAFYHFLSPCLESKWSFYHLENTLFVFNIKSSFFNHVAFKLPGSKQQIVFFSYAMLLLLLVVVALYSCAEKNKKETKTKINQKSQSYFQDDVPVRDSDGQVYKTVRIDSQIWMAENLNKTEIACDSAHTAKFTNGLERGPGVKLYVHEPRYARYKNAKDNGFGVIYNFGVLKYCELCPPGFRIPTKNDWEILIESVGGKSVAHEVLRQRGSNSFNALLGGRIDSYGSVLAGNNGFWWTSDLSINDTGYGVEIGSLGYIKFTEEPVRIGLYVRCIKE